MHGEEAVVNPPQLHFGKRYREIDYTVRPYSGDKSQFVVEACGTFRCSATDSWDFDYAYSSPTDEINARELAEQWKKEDANRLASEEARVQEYIRSRRKT